MRAEAQDSNNMFDYSVYTSFFVRLLNLVSDVDPWRRSKTLIRFLERRLQGCRLAGRLKQTLGWE